MTKILLISSVKPYPLDSGGSNGIFQMIDALRSTFEFTLIYPLDIARKEEKDKLQAIWPDVALKPYLFTGIAAGNVKRLKRRIKLNLNLIKEKLSNKEDFDLRRRSTIFLNNFPNQDQKFLAHINKITSSNAFDIIQIEHTNFIRIGSVLKAKAKTIFVHHEIRSIRAEREFKLLQNRSSHEQNLLKNIRDEEFKLLSAYDKTITLTQPDYDYLKSSIKEKHLAVSPLSIRLPKIEPKVPFKNKLVFMGGSKHFPNVDGLDWFLQKIWPSVSGKITEIELLVTGNWEKRYRNKFTRKNIKFVGFVDDLSEVIKGCIMLVPIRIGSGMRMKILESIAWNIPFISTSIGAEGLPFENRKDCLIADSPEDFQNGIIELCMNAKLRNSLADNSLQSFKDKFSVDKMVKKRAEIYHKLLQI